MIPTDNILIRLFAVFGPDMNKGQGQSLKLRGLDLVVPCFSHERPFVAGSRVGEPSDLSLDAPEGKTRKYRVTTSAHINNLFSV